MTPTRRSFLKLGTGAAAASALGFDLTPAYAQARAENHPHHRNPLHGCAGEFVGL